MYLWILLLWGWGECAPVAGLSSLKFFFNILFHILFHDGLPQDIEYYPLYNTVGPCCFSIYSVLSSLHLLAPTSHSYLLPPTSLLATTVYSLCP